MVTGGAGFIGSNFVKYWLDKYPKDSVVVLDALTYAGRRENLASFKGNPNFSFVKGNICNADLVDSLTKSVDTVVHFAAESHVDRSVSGPGEFVHTNVWGTFTLLEAARKYHTRFHHVSTDEVFGSLPRDSKDKFQENTPYDPRSPYSASKAGSDHLVRAYFHTYGLPVTITNCSNNYGPNHFPEKFIPLTITNLLEGKKVPIYGDGGQKRDWLYVTDHCRAIDLVLQKGVLGETYCVGGYIPGPDGEISNLELTKKILKLMNLGEEWIEYVKDRPGHDQKYAINWDKLKNIGYEPEVSLDEGLAMAIAWYKQNTKWWKKIKGESFKDYYQKQYVTR